MDRRGRGGRRLEGERAAVEGGATGRVETTLESKGKEDPGSSSHSWSRLCATGSPPKSDPRQREEQSEEGREGGGQQRGEAESPKKWGGERPIPKVITLGGGAGGLESLSRVQRETVLEGVRGRQEKTCQLCPRRTGGGSGRLSRRGRRVWFPIGDRARLVPPQHQLTRVLLCMYRRGGRLWLPFP